MLAQLTVNHLFHAFCHVQLILSPGGNKLAVQADDGLVFNRSRKNF